MSQTATTAKQRVGIVTDMNCYVDYSGTLQSIANAGRQYNSAIPLSTDNSQKKGKRNKVNDGCILTARAILSITMAQGHEAAKANPANFIRYAQQGVFPIMASAYDVLNLGMKHRDLTCEQDWNNAARTISRHFRILADAGIIILGRGRVSKDGVIHKRMWISPAVVATAAIEGVFLAAEGGEWATDNQEVTKAKNKISRHDVKEIGTPNQSLKKEIIAVGNMASAVAPTSVNGNLSERTKIEQPDATMQEGDCQKNDKVGSDSENDRVGEAQGESAAPGKPKNEFRDRVMGRTPQSDVFKSHGTTLKERIMGNKKTTEPVAAPEKPKELTRAERMILMAMRQMFYMLGVSAPSASEKRAMMAEMQKHLTYIQDNYDDKKLTNEQALDILLRAIALTATQIKAGKFEMKYGVWNFLSLERTTDGEFRYQKGCLRYVYEVLLRNEQKYLDKKMVEKTASAIKQRLINQAITFAREFTTTYTDGVIRGEAANKMMQQHAQKLFAGVKAAGISTDFWENNLKPRYLNTIAYCFQTFA